MYRNSTHRSPERTPASPRQQQQQIQQQQPYLHHSDRSPSAFHRHPHLDRPASPPRHINAPLNGVGPAAHDKTASTFYDPTSEHRRTSSWEQHNLKPHSPESQSRHNPSYPQTDRAPLSRSYRSPASPHRSNISPPYHTTAIHDRYPTSTKHVPEDSPISGASHPTQSMAPPPPSSAVDRTPSAPSTRVNDPMSFSNILASSDNGPAASPRTPRNLPKPTSAPNHEEIQREPSGPSPAARPLPLAPYTPEAVPSSEPKVNGVNSFRSASSSKARLPTRPLINEKTKSNEDVETRRLTQSIPTKPKIFISDKEYQAALNKIEAMDHSDVENTPGFEEMQAEYEARRQKRVRDLERSESDKRKRRRVAYIVQIADSSDRQSFRSKSRFRKAHEKEAAEQVHTEDVANEKERKKVAQRNRRREITKQRAEQQAIDLKQRAEAADSAVEREKLIKDAERAEKKATATSRLLNGEVPNRDLRESSPAAPNPDGGVGSALNNGEEATEEPPKKRQKLGTNKRLKKSKEQKQAEKDSAAAAQAAIDRGDDLVPLAPKSETTKSKKSAETTVDNTPADRTPDALKYYDQTYEALWKDLAQQVAKRVYKIKKDSTDVKLANCRKTATLASKEARRWQIKTNKSTKDTQARAKRVMREMLSFWKKNERDERDQRKLAERVELDRARQAEKEREDNRQKRKLNFLMSQTELYSHFIWKKVRTDEVEQSTNDVSVSDQTVKPGPPGANTITLPETLADPNAKVTNFEDLDFDAEDDTVLQQAAMANAQNAVEEAQARARAFNNNGELQSQFDDGEMNFQNPTSLQSVDIPQPKMLSCQLKEYQLKGLNWLVNLYEQGINGILADEMGLGKTVQSISVMAYLAEQHNIWGPFLVIAPSSTLHNWQQEITRFVPGLKVLPYWGNAKDRKVLRKYWDRKHITYNKESSFHVLVTSYQLVVQDQQYFQKVRWQYMILDEAQAIKSSQSSRWKSLLGFHCRNRLLLTGTPIQNSMQELWALLHFIMPSLFDSHDEFSDWFSKDIESHAQSNTKLNEDQLQRLHMILKPFMLRRIKKHVQKELGDKIEKDVFCDLTYRQRAYYGNLRDKISIMDLIEKAAVGDDQDTATLMNLVMQFRKVCNHPDLFERAETTSPMSFAYFAETASFLREGHLIDVGYSTRSHIEYRLPRLVGRNNGRINLPGPDNEAAGWKKQLLYHTLNVFTPDKICKSSSENSLFSWLKFIDYSASQLGSLAHKDLFQRAVDLHSRPKSAKSDVFEDSGDSAHPKALHALFNVMEDRDALLSTKTIGGGVLHDLMNISSSVYMEQGLNAIEPCSRPAASAPPVDLYCASQGVIREKQQTFFNVPMRRSLFPMSEKTEQALIESKLDPLLFPPTNMLPAPISEKALWTKIQVPSMRRFVTDSGKLGRLDRLLGELKEGGHRVLLYFQMTRMMDLMEEYLTYRNYKYCRLDGSTKLEDRRDTVADFQSREDIFVFLLSTRAGGLGINLTAADTVIFYDSDWNPTIDSQAMDRAHRLGQTRQVTVYRMITRGTIEERIRQRALQKEEVQRVVISGGAGAQVDFNTRSKENRTKDIAMWLADDDQAAEIEKKEAEIAEKEAKEPPGKKSKKASSKKKVEMSLDDMYHEGEGHFDDSNKPSGAATPVDVPKGGLKRKSKKAKTVKERLAFVDGGA